jgi:hypothetical protein
MGWKRKLGKGEVFKQELFDIMASCNYWKLAGNCKIEGQACPLLSGCHIVKEYDKMLVRCLQKGIKTPYLPGCAPENKPKWF